MKSRRNLHRTLGHSPSRQRGVVLLFALIALVIMLIGATAMVRSFNSSLFMAGNIGFKRDMRNQSELAVTQALTYFRTASLNTAALRANSNTALNYSAVMLPTDAQGIPAALQDANFIGTAPDLKSTDNSVTVRYIIDRLCSTTGNETTLGATSCVLASNQAAPGGSVLNIKSSDRGPLCATCVSAAPQGVIYRLSIRVTGPRNTQSFFQSTFTVPS